MLRCPPLLFLAALALAPALPAEESLFPASFNGGDSGAEGTFYELGTIFRSTVPGTITHLRVYALASETGAHTARLWRNSDNVVVGGPYTWTYGGAAGWIALDIPDVTIAANTDYTVAVTTGGGGKNYPFLAFDFASAGGNGAHLTHPAGAGVFTTSAGSRPGTVFNNSNYFRDVVFTPDPTEPPADAPVRINEIVAENKATLADEDGDFSDWIELYNPMATPVALGGYQLTDGTATWTFPATTLGPQSFVVVFASAKDRATAPLHTNFKLDAAGEYLALKDTAGTIISEFAPTFPKQHANVSYGRGSAGNTGFMLAPTPGSPNGAALAGFVEDTVFSVKRGFFTAPVQVGITTATPGATIRYTLDGSVPTETSAAYSTPFTFSATTMLRARAFKTDFVPTNADTNTYIFANDLAQQTTATALVHGWPASPVNSQVLRYGTDSVAASLYTVAQKATALTQVPTISIVTDQANLTSTQNGLYVNAAVDGLERPGSIELIQPDGAAGFQIDAGLRIRGGQSRGGNFPKHSFNFFFRGEYGTGKLDFPLFGAGAAKKFDSLSLRCEHGYAYADPFDLTHRLEFTAMRDIVCRELWAATGHQSTRSRYYHLLLNGQYWGLYQSEERAQEDFAATYFGGTAAQYDGVAATGLPQLTIEATSGDLTAWTQLWSGARAVSANPMTQNYFALLGRNADGTPNAALPVLLDPRELADYMLLHYYTGHSDEPLSVSFNFEKPNNFRALRRRGLTEPWHFFVHDGESSVRATEWVDNRANVVNLASPNRSDLSFSNPEWMHEDLLASMEYRIAFADEAQRLLFNGGAFSSAKAQALWDALAAQIDQAVIGESIRWAQTTSESQANWNAKVNEVRTQFFQTRTGMVLGQLRQTALRGFPLFPTVDAPVFSRRGGQVASGFQLTLSAAGAGAIYATTDGSDPRAIGGAPSVAAYAGPITIGGPTLVRARFRSSGGEWSALDEVFFTTFTPAAAGQLIVSKVNYHPPGPTAAEFNAGYVDESAFEYLEFQNAGPNTLDLRGVQVNAGVTFDFTNAAITTLAPGARVLAVGNLGGFTMRYGSGLPVAGQFAGNLSNGGEPLRVVDADGNNIAEFTYDDIAPWPLPPDGDGPALVLRAANLDPANGVNWRASYAPGGKPGAEDLLTLADWRAQYFSAADLADPAKESTLWGALADPDRDGACNLLEYALGGSPLAAANHPDVNASIFPDGPGGLHYLRLAYRIREGTTGLAIVPEASGDLATWSAGLVPIGGPVSQGDGTALVIVRDTVALEAAPGGKRFARLRVSVP